MNKIVIDVIKDEAGITVTSLMDASKKHFIRIVDASSKQIDLTNIIEAADIVACFDCKNIVDIHNVNKIIDIRLLSNSDSLSDIIQRKRIKANRFIDLSLKFEAHKKASRETKIDTKRYSLFKTFPEDMLRELFLERAYRIMELSDEHTSVPIEMSCLPALFHIEDSGIRVDADAIRDKLVDAQSLHEKKFLNALIKENKGGFVYSKYNPLGSKTGRVRVHEGFSSMSIPKGQLRKIIVSRFNEGNIYAIDYNAIDFRCMVNSVDDEEFKALYVNCDDFYNRTKELAFANEEISRDDIKKMCLISLYGGQNSLPENLSGYINSLNAFLKPIHVLKEKLFNEAITNGFVKTPCGRIIHTKDNIFPGKVLGLYAQGHASDVFRSALEGVYEYIKENKLKSKIIFIVHDEIVLDIHDEERNHFANIIDICMNSKFRVKYKFGKSYFEASK
jgi:hypothetical protein